MSGGHVAFKFGKWCALDKCFSGEESWVEARVSCTSTGLFACAVRCFVKVHVNQCMTLYLHECVYQFVSIHHRQNICQLAHQIDNLGHDILWRVSHDVSENI